MLQIYLQLGTLAPFIRVPVEEQGHSYHPCSHISTEALQETGHGKPLVLKVTAQLLQSFYTGI